MNHNSIKKHLPIFTCFWAFLTPPHPPPPPRLATPFHPGHNHPEVIINKQGVVIVCFSRKITFSSQHPVEYACNEMMTSGISNLFCQNSNNFLPLISEPYYLSAIIYIVTFLSFGTTRIKKFKHTFSTKFTTLSSFEIIFKPGCHLGIQLFAEVAAEISFVKLV